MFDHLFDGVDPAETSRVAHTTAQALLARVREDPEAGVLDRLIEFTTTHGIDTVADLWAQAPARSLPGALWRLYLLQTMVRQDPHTASLLYERGRHELRSVDPVVAGAPNPAGPAELVDLADTILRGVFRGDFATALTRAASFSRVQATGATHVADDYEQTEPERSSALTTRALRLSQFGADLDASAKLWRLGSLV